MSVTETDDNLLQVGEVARASGKTVRTIHLYEELALLTPTARSKGGYRLYDAEAVNRVRWIEKMQEMGFRLTDIHSVLNEWITAASAPRAMHLMQSLFASKLTETQESIARLQTLEAELILSLQYLETCPVCDPSREVSACKTCDLHGEGAHVPELLSGVFPSGGSPPLSTQPKDA